ncbi:acyl-CoA transferase [Burkholderia sp. Leaf177]|uniref:CaiB/BaiF CoA transferase family protein n=1 Tax=Burkholderia sp. Leaf177 TaxID=1736287 RepID=UPI0006FEA764|nr:CoA transferase [Burkholderia sp. Leaf177]KQR81527.1 acyl-CoA transferase [Burkholderia sp. Leaf177]
MAKLHKKEFALNANGPLQGLKVVDLSRLVAGNMLTLQLADFGADVVKVEPIAGDTLRAFKTDGYEIFWKTYARNKKSVCVDFRRKEAIELIANMIDDADVLVESFRPGTLEEMGLAPATLHERNPRLIIARISGWGQTGIFRNKPGFGTLVEGYSGFASMNGFADREPVLPPMFLGDMTTGIYGANAVMMALWHTRVHGGCGQVLDISLFEPTLSILGPQVANFKLNGRIKPRTGSRSGTTAPRNTYKTSDGKWLCVSTSTQSMAQRLFATIGKPELTDDVRYATNAARVAHVEEIDRIVGSFIGERTLVENRALFDAADVTVGPVFDAADLLDDHYVCERESIVEVDDHEVGQLPMHNVVPRLSATPGGFRFPAPLKGEHSSEILSPLLGDAAYRKLVTDGVIVQTDREHAVAPVA